jgi:hypothetical protein
MHKRVRTYTVVLLFAAWLVALSWLISTRDFEPALTSLALLATMTTFYVDQWLSERERRRELLAAVAHELFFDQNVLRDPLFALPVGDALSPKVYPRLARGAVEYAIASGVFTTARDSALFRLFHSWRERAEDFNQRLNITEMSAFWVSILRASP